MPRQQTLAQANYRNASGAMERMLARVEARKADGIPRLQELWREQQEEAERTRPSRQEIATVNFSTIEPDQDWTDL